MTISAGKRLVGGCVLLYFGGTSAFVTPATLAANHRPASPSASSSTAAAGTATSHPEATAQQQAGSGRRRRRSVTASASSRPSMLDSAYHRAMAVPSIARDHRVTSRAVGPLLMSGSDVEASGKNSAEDGGGDVSAIVPVDAELSGPAAGGTTGGSAGGGGGVLGGSGGGDAATGDPATRAALKQKLLRKVATVNRGFVAEESDRLDVEEIIEMLEMENPNPKSCQAFKTGSSPLAGRWELLYTTSLDVLSLQINPAVTVGKIFQQIEADGRGIQNIIELQPPFAAVNKILGSSMTTLTVKLETDPVSDSRINLKFVRTEIKANSLFGKELDLPTLGVDLPSPEKLEKLIPKRGEGGGGKILTEKVEDAKKKAKEVAQKLKDKKDKTEKTVQEKLESDETKGSEGRGDSSADGGSGGDDGVGGQGEGDVGAADAAQAKAASETETQQNGESGAGDVEKASPDDEESVLPSSLASSLRTPYFESTYVDEDLRIGRTGKGDVFVSIRA